MMQRRKWQTGLRMSIAGASVALLGACDGTIYRTSELGGVSVLSVDARQRIIVVGKRDEFRDVRLPDGTVGKQAFQRTVTCAEPSPDAIVAQASTLAAKANAPEVAGELAASLSESAGSIGLRTQSIQLLRDGYYRICEAYLNGAIGQDEYRLVIEAIDVFMITLVAIEAVTGVVVAPAISLGTKGQLTIGADGAASTSTEAVTSVLKEVRAKSETLTDAQVAAVTAIIRDYYKARARLGT